MAKARYIVGTGSEQKLKRNVPRHLKGLAGKHAWVERIAHLAAKEAKQRANLFAVRTDAELKRLQARLEKGEEAPSDCLSALDLDLTRARQIALSYFHKRDQANLDTGAYFLSQDDPDYDELLEVANADFREALDEASGHKRTTDPRALELLVEHGVLSRSKADQLNASGWPDELASHRAFQGFCRLLERADLELAKRRYRSWETGSLAIIDSSIFGRVTGGEISHSSATSAGQGKTIADLKSAFLKQHVSKVTKSRAAQYRIPFRVLEERLGPNMALGSITRDDARNLAEFLPRIPPYATWHHKGHSLADAADRHEAATGAPANRSKEAKTLLQVITQAFDFAVNEQWLTSNPFRGIGVNVSRDQRKKYLSKKDTYEPFPIADLNKLFALPLFTGSVDDENGCHKPGPNIVKRHRYWAPIIALWTGMRENEILQLEKADFGKTDSGVTFVRVTDEEHGNYNGTNFAKRVKTENAIRDIPLHPIFEQIGFLEWVKNRPDGRLFPEAATGAAEKPSDLYSKRFRTNLKAAKVWKSRRLVFHSLRNNFNDALRDAGVPEELRKAINGWQEQRSMDQRYGRGQKVETLFEHVSKVEYPGLSLEFLNRAEQPHK